MKNFCFRILVISSFISILSINNSFATPLKDKDAQEIRYTKEEEKVLLKKIKEMNDYDKKLDYYYLTKKEELIRLEIMKERYPIDWYIEIMKGFDVYDSCQVPHVDQDKRCIFYKEIPNLSRDQIISIFLHYDTIPKYVEKLGAFQVIDVILLTKTISGNIGNYSNGYKGDVYGINSISGYEIREMISHKIIINRYNIEYQIKNIRERFKF